MNTSIWWIRRDLRLSDNTALSAALNSTKRIIPLFIIDPRIWNVSRVGDKRIAFILGGLKDLNIQLQRLGGYLVLRCGDPLVELKKLVNAFDVDNIFAEEDYSPYARIRDGRVSDELPLQLVRGLTVHHPEDVMKPNGSPYSIFTPFSRAWKSLPLPGLSSLLPKPKNVSIPWGVTSVQFPAELDLQPNDTFRAGEKQAQKRLDDFISGEQPLIYKYGEQRDRPDLNGTSSLSPYLRFGMISIRRVTISVLAAIKKAPDDKARKSAETFLNELIWREFFNAIHYHYPNVHKESFRQDLRGIQWVNNISEYEAWQQGVTGYPIIDAGMRQLFKTGWMHNRVRMIVASFLTKDLLVDWRWGERRFMQNLIDGDPAANNGGWQWTAGTGTDAAPYFRVFNPVLQSEKFDPKGFYIREWVPELRDVPGKFLHKPWEMPDQIQKQVGCIIGKDYPAPIIDHRWARNRALEAYKKSKLDESLK